MLGSLPRTPYLSQTRQPAFHRATACTAKRFQNPVAYFSFWNLFSGPLFPEKKYFLFIRDFQQKLVASRIRIRIRTKRSKDENSLLDLTSSLSRTQQQPSYDEREA